MKNRTKLVGLATVVAIIGFAVIACGGDDNSGDNKGNGNSGGGGTGGVPGSGDDITLPQSVGENEVAEKTLYPGLYKIVFAETGTTFKAYYMSRYHDEEDNYVYGDDKLSYEGKYSYNSTNKTITLATEYIYWYGTKMNMSQAVAAWEKEWEEDFDSYVKYIKENFDSFIGEFKEERGHDWLTKGIRDTYDEYYKKCWENNVDDDDIMAWDEFVENWLEENNIHDGNSFINAMLQAMGYSSLDAYKNAVKKVEIASFVEWLLSQRTYDYQITKDGLILVQEKLPANKGTNELSGKTFARERTFSYNALLLGSGYSFLGNHTFTYSSPGNYTFTATGYTVEFNGDDSSSEFETGTYAYDSVTKEVWLQPTTIFGKTILEVYEDGFGNSDEDGLDNSDVEKAESIYFLFQVYDWSYEL